MVRRGVSEARSGRRWGGEEAVPGVCSRRGRNCGCGWRRKNDKNPYRGNLKRGKGGV